MLVLALSFVGCTTVATIGGIKGYHFPTQEGIEIGIKIRSSSGVDKEVVSVDQEMVLPVQTNLELGVPDEIPSPETVVIALIISSIVRAINSIPISLAPIF